MILRRIIRLVFRHFLPHNQRSWFKLQCELLRNCRNATQTDAPNYQRVTVLAPHMDDEVFGCGGTINLCIQKCCSVSVVYLTDGRKGYNTLTYRGERAAARRNREIRLMQTRKEEARRAARMLGYSDLYFLDFPEGFSNGGVYVDRLARTLLTTRPQVIFLPFLTDPHPDHWMTNVLFVEATEKAGLKRLGIQCWGYEIWSPVPANTIVDITDVADLKIRAIKAFESQLWACDFSRVILGLNSYRSLTGISTCRFAEGYYIAQFGVYQSLFEAALLCKSNK